MPFVETVLKDINYSILWVVNFFKNGFKDKTLLVFPHYPSRGSTIFKVGKQLGFNITNKAKKNMELAVYWEYLTFREEFEYLEKLSATTKVINLHSRDISKQHVDAIHQDVFGYSTIVDPLTYSGKMVKKNDVNAKHDGEIFAAPIASVEAGFIYQILIDNTHSDKLVMDIRVPVVGKVLDFAYLKYRDISERFKNTTIKTELEPITKIFSEEEIFLLNAFCKMSNLEYGELDVLRNKADGKIYVVDVNNTPQGPPANISPQNGKRALESIGKALLEFSAKGA
jgi:hypothetical protein